MRRAKWNLLAVFPLFLTGCASTPVNVRGDYAEVTPAQGSDPDLRGMPVRWGGVVVGTRLTDGGECAEVAQFPLDRFTSQPFRVFPGGNDGLHRGLLATVSLGHAQSTPHFLACPARGLGAQESRVGAVITLVGTLQPALVFEVSGRDCVDSRRIEANGAPDYSGTMHASSERACFISLPTIRIRGSHAWPEGPSQHLASLR